MTIRIETILERDVSDADLQRLFMRAYVEGGFTAPERAAEIFSPAAVRARGEVLCAWPAGWTSPAGVVVLVLPPSPARRLAGDDEAEMHLLATDPECRRMGVGRALVDAAMDRAREAGLRRMLLWTQPSMRAARRLYASAGFAREPERDFQVDGRRYLVLAADL
jgi:ribosomal protein S18 acetylase RimI-like enzyme